MDFLGGIAGGGNILNVVLNNAARMAFPQAAVMGAVSNTLANVMGDALRTVADRLANEGGMPSFVRTAVHDAVHDAMPGLTQNSSPEVDDFVRAQFGGPLQGIFDSIVDEMIELITSAQESGRAGVAGEEAEGTEGTEGTGGTEGAGSSGKSWFVQLAMALGAAMNNQADKMEDLSAKITAEFDNVAEATDNVDSETGEGQGEVVRKEGARFELMQEFQAEAQVFNMLAQVVQNVISTMGQGLSTASRKQ